jgi:predicted N-formylglutamate amidohydrolase
MRRNSPVSATASGRALLLSCEHGGNDVPAEFRDVLAFSQRTLASHRGFDRGALAVAAALAQHFRAPLLSCTVTRLLVDHNRPPDHPDVVGRGVDAPTRRRLLDTLHRPYWRRLERAVARCDAVLHVAVHSFTPVRCGVRRDADIALLYDPMRAPERAFCARWLCSLARLRPWRLQRNYPYKGTDPGLTTYLRTRFPAEQYLGIELEMNQRFFRAGAGEDVISALIASLASCGV